MNIETLVVGSMATNCYLVFEKTKELFIVDPGDDANYIAQLIQTIEAIPTAIIATHGHFDHIMGARELQLIFHIPFFVHEKDRFLVGRMQETAKYFLKHEIVETPPHIDKFLSEGDRVGNFIVMHTPGHTPGSICLVGKGEMFTGDTIFSRGAVGRTDFSYSEPLKLSQSLDLILSYSKNTRLLPGHGKETTVEKEKSFHSEVIE